MTAKMTTLLGAAILAAYCLEQALGANAVCHAYGLVPAHPSFGTALSSMFLHAGFSHLAGNLLFLVIFGTIVEQEIGSVRFLGLYVTAELGGAAMHALIDPSSTVPLVGCSGALCGLLAVAGALKPRTLGFVVAFIGLNVWNAFTGAESNVSFGCHIGGFVVGAVIAMYLRMVEVEA